MHFIYYIFESAWVRKNQQEQQQRYVYIYKPNRWIRRGGSAAVPWFLPARVDRFRFHRSCCKPSGPNRHKFCTQYHRRTSGSRSNWLDRFRCRWDSEGMNRPWASGPSPISPEPLRPARSGRSQPGSTPLESLLQQTQRIRELKGIFLVGVDGIDILIFFLNNSENK